MDLATHGPTGQTFLAIDFQKIDLVERERLREQLVCPGCGALAYFVPPTKRGACYFGARPHREGCDLGTLAGGHSASSLPEEEQRLLKEGAFRLRPHRPGARSAQHHLEHDPIAPPTARRARQYTREPGTRQTTASVGLRSLLTKLDEDPCFARSTDRIEFPDGRHAQVSYYCINVVDLTDEHVNRKRLFWGTIHKAVPARHDAAWLYTQYGSPNVLLPKDMLQLVMADNDLESLDEFAGAAFLYLGFLNRSAEGSVAYFVARDPEWFVVRLGSESR